MKNLFAIAAFLLASTAAQAQYTFEFNGHTIRIDPDRGTVSIPGSTTIAGDDQRARRTAIACANRPRQRPRSIRSRP